MLAYPVIVREAFGATVAYVPDFPCQAVGANQSEAIANVKRIAEKVLKECEMRGAAPPRASRLSLAHIELPESASSPATLLRRRPDEHL